MRNNLNEINFENDEIQKVKQLIKIEEPKIMEIIENYKNNKYNINSVEKEIKSVIRKESFSTLKICKLKVKDSMETTVCPKINERKKYVDINYDDMELESRNNNIDENNNNNVEKVEKPKEVKKMK